LTWTGRLPASVGSQAGSRADLSPLASKCLVGVPSVFDSRLLSTPRFQPGSIQHYGLTKPAQDTYYVADAQYLEPVPPINLYSPHNLSSPGSAAPLSLTAYPHLGTDHSNPSWHHHLPPQDPPRHLIPHAQNPTIRVISAPESQLFAPPQTGFASSSIYRQPQAPLNSINPYYDYHPHTPFNMTDLSPTTVALPTLHEHKRTASVNSLNGDMPTPVSLACPQSPMTSPTAGEHRQSIVNSPPRSHSRGLSVDSSQDGDDDGSLRKNHSYKRAEEPPRNEDGKMVCKYQECQGTSFDRKCEWR
jgi:hypothetical protein